MIKTLSNIAFVSLTLLFISVGGGETGLQRGPQRISPAQNNQNIRIDADYGKMPLYFIPNRLKYEFIVHPGADPSRIRLAYQGGGKRLG